MIGKIKVGSRESKLAVIQSQIIIDKIKEFNPNADIELVTMKTTGDMILNKSLKEVGGKGLFVKELDRALIDKRTDISVHSLKDMPMEIPDSLPIVAFYKREDPRDVLILPKGTKIMDLNKPIGCAGIRRTLQLEKLFDRKGICKIIRGNVLTRLEKLDKGEYGALVLAYAGIKRLGLENRISRIFEVDEIIPAAGQGIIAVQGRKGENYSFLECCNDKNSYYAAVCERAFVSALNGGCSSPVAAYANIEKDNIHLTGLYYDKNENAVIGRIKGNVSDSALLGKTLAERLKAGDRFE